MRKTCNKCTKKIARHKLHLICHECERGSHFTCNNLTKTDALKIINKRIPWTCQLCTLELFPINLPTPPPKRKRRTRNIPNKNDSATNIANPPNVVTCIKCSTCMKTLGAQYSHCHWCNKPSHIRCSSGDLGCHKCNNEMFAGFGCSNPELWDYAFSNTDIFNPYSHESNIQHIGDKIESITENESYSHISETLLNCNYVKLSKVKSPKSNELNVLSLNIRSIRNNITQITDNINDYEKFDIICLNETNCNPDSLPHGINDLAINGYHMPIIQNPSRHSNRGGGLAIYVKTTVCSANDIVPLNEISDNENFKTGEFLFVKINACKNLRKDLIIGNMYRSPSTSPTTYLDCLKRKIAKLKKYKSKHILLLGDANVDLIRYDDDANAQELINITASYGFAPIISRPTRITDHRATLIDHIYTNDIHEVTKSGIVTLDISDHLGTYASILLDKHPNSSRNFNFQKPEINKTKYRQINQENINKFHNLISNENWDKVNDTALNAQEKYTTFLTIYETHYNVAFPLITTDENRRHKRANPKPWILPWLEDACNRKNGLYHLYVKQPSVQNKTKYKKMKKFVDTHIKRAKKQYYSNYFKQYSKDSRKQWQMINSLINRNKTKIKVTKLTKQDAAITSKNGIADTFNEYFCNIANTLKQGIPTNTNAKQQLGNRAINTMYIVDTTPTEINEIINNFKNKTTSDTAIIALKAANRIHSFSDVISNIVNTSFHEGIVPAQLKLAKVVPIHKSGKRTDATNYRPISLLSAFSKIYERAMHTRLENFVNSSNTLHEHQYGFRKQRSCEHALVAAQQKILDTLDKKQIALLLLIDFSKAFDMVDHEILLKKLDHYGIRGIGLKWFQSYLSNRRQFVHVNNTNSSTRELNYGVPQGSILGPLLFVIYINDMPQICKLAKFILYADDANIFITADNMNDIERIFKTLSDELNTWVNSNGLMLNVTKTNYMIFTNNNSARAIDINVKYGKRTLARKTSARFLGVLMDEKITWREHIATLSLKMSRNAGILYKMKGILPQKVMKTLYHSFIQSHLNYCSIIWGLGPKAKIQALFIAQKKAIRTLIPGFANYFYNKDTGEKPHRTKKTFAVNEIMTVHNQILANVLVFMHKIHREVAPNSIKRIFATNDDDITTLDGPEEIFVPSLSRLEMYKNSILHKGPKLYNEITHYITLENKKANINTPAVKQLFVKPFKRYIKNYLLDIQSEGDEDEWSTSNYRLYAGSRSSSRIVTQDAQRTASQHHE